MRSAFSPHFPHIFALSHSPAVPIISAHFHRSSKLFLDSSLFRLRKLPSLAGGVLRGGSGHSPSLLPSRKTLLRKSLPGTRPTGRISPSPSPLRVCGSFYTVPKKNTKTPSGNLSQILYDDQFSNFEYFYGYISSSFSFNRMSSERCVSDLLMVSAMFNTKHIS